ncbi:MAG: lysophospholipid acyltransferase family protein [Acidobacteriota bacterium]
MSRRKSFFLQSLEYGAYRSLAAIVKRAGDETLIRWGSRFGSTMRSVLRSRDRTAIRNLAAVFPERSPSELREIADECWRHFGRESLLTVRMQTRSAAEIAERCPFVNDTILAEAVARGKGVVLISAHFGGWEIGGLALMTLVDNVRTVARKLDNEYLEADLAAIRARTGAQVIDRRKAARPLMKGLAENAVVVLLPDQAVQPREGVLVPFLGRPAWTTDAPAKMALRHDSPIVFAFCIPEGSGHRLVFEEPIRIESLSEAERDPERLTALINDVISRRITERPELWLWMHDRWKGTGESANGE